LLKCRFIYDVTIKIRLPLHRRFCTQQIKIDMFVSKNNLTSHKTVYILEERTRFVTANSAVARLGCSGIYSHKTNMISGKIFASSFIQIHIGEGRLCIEFLSNLQHHSAFPLRRVHHHCSPFMNLFHDQI
jgi:hypothetical protein